MKTFNYAKLAKAAKAKEVATIVNNQKLERRFKIKLTTDCVEEWEVVGMIRREELLLYPTHGSILYHKVVSEHCGGCHWVEVSACGQSIGIQKDQEFEGSVYITW